MIRDTELSTEILPLRVFSQPRLQRSEEYIEVSNKFPLWHCIVFRLTESYDGASYLLKCPSPNRLARLKSLRFGDIAPIGCSM